MLFRRFDGSINTEPVKQLLEQTVRRIACSGSKLDDDRLFIHQFFFMQQLFAKPPDIIAVLLSTMPKKGGDILIFIDPGKVLSLGLEIDFTERIIKIRSF